MSIIIWIYVGGIVCSKHRLWGYSFHKEYSMVLHYLKGSSLYSSVI
jgi:hypothetical protein